VTAISAHRGGGEQAAPGTYAAYRSAVALGADAAEFDVRRTRDGELVACHPARAGRPARPVAELDYAGLCRAAGYEVPKVGELARLLAGHAAAHVDLKEAGCAADAIGAVLAWLEPGVVLATTRDVAVARRLAPLVPVALTIGGDSAQRARFTARRLARPGWSPLDAASECGAAWVAVHYRSATPALLAGARRRGLKVAVWTVNGGAALRRWLHEAGTDLVVTDEPARAIRLRDLAGR